MKQKQKPTVIIPQKYLKQIVKIGNPHERKVKPFILRNAQKKTGSNQITTQSDVMRPLKRAIKQIGNK